MSLVNKNVTLNPKQLPLVSLKWINYFCLCLEKCYLDANLVLVDPPLLLVCFD